MGASAYQPGHGTAQNGSLGWRTSTRETVFEAAAGIVAREALGLNMNTGHAKPGNRCQCEDARTLICLRIFVSDVRNIEASEGIEGVSR